MIKYTVKRLLLMIPTILGLVLIVMAILNIIPGTGIKALSSYSGNSDKLDSLLAWLHLHETFFGRYIRFLANVFTGNLKAMRSTGIIMTVELPMRIKNTLSIAAGGIIASFLFGIPLGFTAAIYRGKTADNIITASTILLSSIPSYCIAVICTLIFVLWLRVLPLTGFGSPIHFVNPAIVTAIPGIAVITAMTRSAVLKVLGEPYITALRATGMSPQKVLRVHVFKNTFVVFMSSFQNIAIGILCGGMIAENFFSIPGLGVMLVNAVANRSAYLCLCCILIFATLIMLISLACDLICMAVDPKFRKKILEGGRT